MSYTFLWGVLVGFLIAPTILVLAFAAFAIKTGWSTSLEKRSES